MSSFSWEWVDTGNNLHSMLDVVATGMCPPISGVGGDCSKASSNYEAKKQKSSTSFMVSFFHTSCSTFFVKASKSRLFNYIWTSHHHTAKLIHSYSFPFSEKATIKLFRGIWMNVWHHIQFWLPRDFKKFNSPSNSTGRRTRHIQFQLGTTRLSGFQGFWFLTTSTRRAPVNYPILQCLQNMKSSNGLGNWD